MAALSAKFQVGQRVAVHFLSIATEFNGIIGKERSDLLNGRHQFTAILSDRTTKAIQVKQENLREAKGDDGYKSMYGFDGGLSGFTASK